MADSTLAGTGFQTFFAGSKAVDKSGQPLRLYHGTVNDFSVFDRSRSNIDGYFGAGFYFSSAAAVPGVPSCLAASTTLQCVVANH